MNAFLEGRAKKRNLKVKRLFAKVVGTRIEEEKNLLYVKWNGKGFGETRRIVIVKKIPVMQNRLFSHSPLYMHTLFATQILILNGLGNMHSSQEHLKQWFLQNVLGKQSV